MILVMAVQFLAPVRIRLVEASDADRVRAGIAQLSPSSLLSRYGKATVPTERELAWLGELDTRASVAFGACDPASDSPVGLARYVAAQDADAEIAVTVVDAWQGHGVGGMLLAQLVEHAATVGIETLRAAVAVRNVPALRPMRGIGGTAIADPQFGVVELRARVRG